MRCTSKLSLEHMGDLMVKQRAARAKATSDKDAADSIVSVNNRDAVVSAARASLFKQYGDGAFQNLEGVTSTTRFPYQLSTGSLGLDLALGPVRKIGERLWIRGAAPARMIELYGPEGSGKTTIALHMTAFVQRWFAMREFVNAGARNRVAYVDVEHACDPTYMRNLGVDLKNLDFAQPGSGEEALDIVDRLLKTQAYGLIVIDSVASLTPQAEIDGEIGDAHVGRLARLLSQTLKRWAGVIGMNNDNPCTILFINQERDKVGMGGRSSGTTTPGGRALKFYAGYRIRIRPDEIIMAGENRIGHNVHSLVAKNKVQPPFRESTAPLWYGQGIHRYAELAEMCIARGVIKQSGAWYSHPGFKGSIQGVFNLVSAMQADANFTYGIYDELLTAHNASVGLDPYGKALPGFVEVSPPQDFMTEEDKEEEKAIAAELFADQVPV
jgi:recombination protein RecA